MLQRCLTFLLLLTLLWPVAGDAEIFKCVAANGELTFSQTPCLDSKVTVQKSTRSNDNEPQDCEYAHRFALMTAQEMKTGAESSAVFDRYGGLSALSRGSVSLISYVYQYRTNNDVSAERVAALSVAKCQARSFGDVGCEQLPDGFTSRLGGCEQGDEKASPAALPFVNATPSQAFSLPQDSIASQQEDYRATRAREEQQRTDCRERIRSQIDKINAQMRSGYTGAQGSSLRNRRRQLEKKLREC